MSNQTTRKDIAKAVASAIFWHNIKMGNSMVILDKSIEPLKNQAKPQNMALTMVLANILT